MFFVNLNLRSVHTDAAVLDRFLARGVHPELGLDPILMDTASPGWHKDTAAKLADHGLTAALHLPFFDLQPGSADNLIRQATKERLSRAMDIAQTYSPAHMIGHVSYDHMLYMHSYRHWRERAADTWQTALCAWPEHPPLYLENTFEPDPATVAGMVDTLRAQGMERVGLCLDVGHWYSFAGGRQLANLDAWLDAAGPSLAHLHLHDNDGSFDQHKGLGQGGIPWESFFTGLSARGLRPSVTFEPHSDEDFYAAMEFVRAHPAWFSPLGVSAPRV